MKQNLMLLGNFLADTYLESSLKCVQTTILCIFNTYLLRRSALIRNPSAKSKNQLQNSHITHIIR